MVNNAPTRYPLQWPMGWKRTAYRATAKFSKYDKRLSVADGVQRVLLELDRAGDASLRLTPPLIIGEKEAKEALDIIAQTLKEEG